MAFAAAVAVMASAAAAQEGEDDSLLVETRRRLGPAPSKVPDHVDTNKVMRLGEDLPEHTLVGDRGSKRLYCKGVLALCGDGPRSFELAEGGQFALGSADFVFDSPYYRGASNSIVFSGGGFAAIDSAAIKSPCPIRLTGTVRLIAVKTMRFFASVEGPGTFIKCGAGTLGFAKPCDGATGSLVITNGSTVVFSDEATWGGKVIVGRGSKLVCTSVNYMGEVVAEKGAEIVERRPGAPKPSSRFPQPATGYRLDKMKREKIGRSLVAWRISKSKVRVSWRYLGADPPDAAFDVLRNGRRVASGVRNVTYFDDSNTGVLPTTYSVGGESYRLPANAPIGYIDIPVRPPAAEKLDGKDVSYFVGDANVADLDGDGQYELVLIWWPRNAGDNSTYHKTSPVWLEGIELSGKSLWRISLGPNIRAGSHYVPVMAYDLDGDGRAEVVCRTAPMAPDFRKTDPHVVFAPNFVSVFDGATGRELDKVPFNPSVSQDPEVIARKDHKAVTKEWNARNPGNQAFRFLSAVAYLDGVHPSVVMCRGYYSRTALTAYDWDGRKLKERWRFWSDDDRWWTYRGQGFHNLRVGDVDFDGRDEIVYGDMVVDDSGEGLYTTGQGHGDALNLIQRTPYARGLQVWTCHEASPFGVTLRDAETGRFLLHRDGPKDTGTCNALDIDPSSPGYELFSGANCGFFCGGTLRELVHPKPKPRVNYFAVQRGGVWWLGDLTRSAYSGGDTLFQYSVRDREVREVAKLEGGVSNHGSKGSPVLVADLLGDWREEVILRTEDDRHLRLYLSPEPTKYRFWSLMEDPVYRISVGTQNNGYHVAPEPGFYFGPDLLGHGIDFRGAYLR